MPLGTKVSLIPGDSVLDGDPVPPPHKGGGAPSPIFGPFLLWPNGWMHQGATWYRGRPQPRRLCVRRGLSYPIKKGTPTPTQFLAHVYCGQMAGWMKTPLGTEVDLGPGYTVLDGVPASAKGAQQPPIFGPCLLWPRPPISATGELLLTVVWFSVSARHCAKFRNGWRLFDVFLQNGSHQPY